jgi:D-xylose transport system permease protein
VTNVADAQAGQASGGAQEPVSRPSIRGLIAKTEIDMRLFGMLAALAVILIVFHVISGYKLIQPANMTTLAVQASGIAIIATGMVLVIVSRNIDLSVGSLVGLIAMSYSLLMTDWLPNILHIGPDVPFQWAIALALGIGIGAFVGAVQGFIIAYVGVPSFIVTLGGLLSIRGLIWYQSQGAAVTGLNPTFQLIGGGAIGSAGELVTWLIGIVGCLGLLGWLYNSRRQRKSHGFPVRPVWAEILLAGVGSAAVLGLAWFANSNFWPKGLADKYAADHGLQSGLLVPTGFPNPAMLLIGVTLVVSWLATRRRYGRYVYAYGGNPDAAELAGINTRWTIMKTFMLMGVLCALSAAIASARLNGATLDIGQSYELYVIAAAVVGGTSFAGGIGTIPGAVIGAFVMQSLSYGLSFIGVNSPGQNVVAGIVLILAVGFDTWNRRRTGGKSSSISRLPSWNRMKSVLSGRRTSP